MTSLIQKEIDVSVTYSFTLSFKDTAAKEYEAFLSQLPEWRIEQRRNGLFLCPLDDDGGHGDISNFIRSTLLKYASDLEKAASITAAQGEISVAVFYDENKFAAICPTIRLDVIRQLAAFNLSLELCIFPCSE